METCGNVCVSEDCETFLLKCLYCTTEILISDWAEFVSHIRNAHTEISWENNEIVASNTDGSIEKPELVFVNEIASDQIDFVESDFDIEDEHENENQTEIEAEWDSQHASDEEVFPEQCLDEMLDLPLVSPNVSENNSSESEESDSDFEKHIEKEREHITKFPPTVKFLPSFTRRNPRSVYFIKYYESHPELWDPDHVNYRNDEERSKALKAFMLEMESSVNVSYTEQSLKQAIWKLHDQFFGVAKQIENGCDKINMLALKYYERSKFLSKVEHTERMEGKRGRHGPGPIQLIFNEDDEFTSDFIDLYAMFPQLYDPQHKDYLHMDARKLAYATIAQEITIEDQPVTNDDVARAILSLRQWYCKTNRSRKPPTDTKESELENYYLDKCCFLPQKKVRLKLQCEICQKEFFSDQVLQSHMFKEHQIGELPYKCPFCDRRFDNRADMNVHKQRAHMTKSKKCEYCDKTFAVAADLRLHVRTHTGEKPYICESCGKAFRSKFQLNYHNTAVHTKIRAHKCNMCSKSFFKRRNLSDHIKGHMNIRDKKCEICGKGFTNCHSLIRHRKIHQKNKDKKKS